MTEYVFTINGKDYKVNVKNIEKNIAEIELDGKTFMVNIKQLGVKTKIKKPVIKREITQSKKIGNENKKIFAPLPGVILDIKVRENQEVKEGDELLIMEAMKMENSIQAPFSGIVKRINVNKDDTVQEDDVLLELGS